MRIAVRETVILLLGIVLCAMPAMSSGAGRQPEKLTLAFYNVENLYDTIPSLFYDDGDYTPAGRLGWDTEKYRKKIENIARVLDGIDADIIGLAEIENAGVIADLVLALGDDYNFLHLPDSDYRGMDMAVLYKGDKFVPLDSRRIPVGTSRNVLHVRGKAADKPVDLIVCHMPSRLNDDRRRFAALNSLRSVADSLHGSSAEPMVVVMGDFNAAPSEKVMKKSFGTGGKKHLIDNNFFSPFEKTAAEGGGTYAYDNRWQLYDNIFLSNGFLSGHLRYSGCGVFVRTWMLGQEPGSRRTYPLRTFTAGRYTGGFSDHLPVYVTLEIMQ